jgi:protoporphyrinogen oxidase
MDAPEDVAKAASRLDYNKVVVVGVAVDRPAPLQHWAYVPDPGVPLHRYAWTSNFSPNNAPPHKSVLLAEVTAPREAEVDLEALTREVLEGLEELGVVKRRDILFARAWIHEYGYPVYTLDHREARETVLKWLEELGVVSIGRWGNGTTGTRTKYTKT